MISALNWDFWATACFNDDGGGSSDGGGGDDKSSAKGKFDDSRSELEAAGYTVSADGKSVSNATGQVAGEGWSGSRSVDDIVSGGGGQDRDDSPAPPQPQAMVATETNNPSNYFADRDNDGVPNIFDFDDGVGFADTARDAGGRDDDDGPRTDYSGLSFNDAFSQARSNLGPGQTFTYNGGSFSTATAEERPDIAAADAARRNQEVAASFEEEATAADREISRLQTPRTDLDLSGGISSLLPPPSRDRDRTPAVAVDEFSGLPPSMTDQFYTPPTVSDTGFITDDRGVDYTPPAPVVPTTPVVMAPPTGILTATQAADQLAGIQAQQQAYQDMLARAQAAERARTPALPTTPVPVDFAPSIDLRDERGSLLPPARDRSGVTSIGYDIGQIDPGLARAAGIQEGQPAFGQTTGRTTLEQLYGREIPLTEDTLADMTLASGRLAETQQLLQARPDLVLAPPSMPIVVPTGQVPAGTPGAQAPQDIYMADEVQTLLDASPQARTVYQDLGITRTTSIDVAGDPNAPRYSYRDAAGNQLSAQQVADALRSASTTTLPGGYIPIAPLDITTPTIPALDIGLTPVDVATPVTVVSAPGGGGGGGGTAGGGSGRGDPRDFGFVAEEAAASRGSPAGIEGLLERSPTLGQPATTTVPQAADIIMPGVETSPTVSREPPPEMVPPGGEEAPSIDVTIAPRDEVGGEPEAAEDVEVQVDTGEDTRMGAEEDTGTGREEAGAPGGVAGDEGAGEGVEVGIGAGEDEGAGTGGEGGGEGTGEGTGTGAGEGEGTGTGTGGGEGTGVGDGTGTGTGTGAGEGEGEGDGEPSGEEDTEVVVDEGEEELPVEEEEEPAFECPPGFRRVQMANGGFTCVPEMVRPRVGPFTQTVDVSGLQGRTVFRPGTRRT